MVLIFLNLLGRTDTSTLTFFHSKEMSKNTIIIPNNK